jgi:hypothetical protein
MPNPKYIGTFPVTLKQVFERKIDGSRLYSITEVYANDNSAVYGSIGSSVVVDGFTHYQISNSSDAKDGLVEVTRTYVYAPASPDLYEYQCNAVASEEPIETHPNFLTAATTLGFDLSIVTASGGFLAEGSTSGGAVFDADGIFLGFNKDALNNLAGVRSYLSPQVTFQVKYATDDRPSSGTQTAIGTRSTPLNPPSVGSGKNWLLTEVNWTNTGNGGDGAYQISEGYRLSGEGGWNTNIYS